MSEIGSANRKKMIFGELRSDGMGLGTLQAVKFVLQSMAAKFDATDVAICGQPGERVSNGVVPVHYTKKSAEVELLNSFVRGEAVVMVTSHPSNIILGMLNQFGRRNLASTLITAVVPRFTFEPNVEVRMLREFARVVHEPVDDLKYR